MPQLRAMPSSRKDVSMTSLTRILVRRFLERRLLIECLLKRDVELVGHQLGQSVGFGEAQLQRAGDVFESLLGAQRSKGDDLRDLLTPIFLGDVLDHFATTVRAEIHVDVGERNTPGFRKRSKSRLNFNGSTSVMPMQ